MSKIDDFKEYARRRIVERMRESKEANAAGEANAGEEKTKIEPYEGEDSFYSGSDEEYKEFLDGLDIDLGGAEPVENTGKIDLGETINVKEVLDKVKETAGNIAGAAAAKVSEAAEKRFRVRDDEDGSITRFEKVEDNISAGIDDMKTAITDSMNDSMQKIEGIDERLGGVSAMFEETKKSISGFMSVMSDFEKRLQALEDAYSERADGISADVVGLKNDIGKLGETSEQIREAVNGVSKLSDSVFDMKNAQQNTKTAIAELQTAFIRLKKKTMAGITVISIIGFIIIVLEVINLLA